MNEKELLRSIEIFYKDKHVVITGAGAGIGKAFADRLHKLGAQVSAIDIVYQDEKPEYSIFSHDVTKGDSLSTNAQCMPKVDILIIAAGVTSKDDSPSNDEVEKMHAVNVIGVENTLRAFAPRLKQSSQIVYIGTDDPPKLAYKKTKLEGAAIVSDFSEENNNVDCRLLHVGPVKTDLFLDGKPDFVVERIRKEVGLYEANEFAQEVLVDLLSTKKGLTVKKMYAEAKGQ